MKIFDYTSTHVALGISGIFVAVINLYLIYTIWKNSPSSMGNFRFHLFKMVCCDFFFTLSLFYVLMPNLIFPIPGATVEGLGKYLGRPGGMAAHIITVWIGALTQWTISDCCMFRYFVFFKKNGALEWFGGRKAVCYFLTIATFLIVYISLFFSYTCMNYEELIDYTHRHNLSMGKIGPDTPFVAFDSDSMIVLTDTCLIIFFLIYVETSNMSLSLAVHKKINQVKGSLSAQTYKMQRSLTYVMIAQITIPAIGIIIPVPFYMVSIYTDVLLFITDTNFIEILSVISVAGYPLFNSLFTLCSVSAYRKATIERIKKVLFFIKFKETESVLILNPSSVSGGLGTANVS